MISDFAFIPIGLLVHNKPPALPGYLVGQAACFRLKIECIRPNMRTNQVTIGLRRCAFLVDSYACADDLNPQSIPREIIHALYPTPYPFTAIKSQDAPECVRFRLMHKYQIYVYRWFFC
jgi:hypothetical protein